MGGGLQVVEEDPWRLAIWGRSRQAREERLQLALGEAKAMVLAGGNHAPESNSAFHVSVVQHKGTTEVQTLGLQRLVEAVQTGYQGQLVTI